MRGISVVKIERTTTVPGSLVKALDNGSGSYTEFDVIRQLRQDFHEKCYLCEIDKLQSVNVEHLTPHKGNPALKYDWNNLFLSCPHCNLVKNQEKYSGKILDCCSKDPEDALSHTFQNNHVSVTPLDDSIEAKMTAILLTECFEKSNTGIRELECQTRIDALSETMNLLYKQLKQFKKDPKEKTIRTLKGMLSRTYKFSGFTRNYVRTHLDDYPQLSTFL